MKKIGICTLYYKNRNYGANLQVYALRTVLSSLGCEAEVVMYYNNTKLYRCFLQFKDTLIWHGVDGIILSLKDHPLTYSAWAKLYRREVIGETRFLTGIKINEDSFFVFQILCKKPTFVGINHGVYRYNVTIGSASREGFSDKFFDILKIAELKNDIIINTFPEFCSLADNMKLKARLNLLSILASRAKREYCDLEKDLIRYI